METEIIYGRVTGPYTRSSGAKSVGIHLLNRDGKCIHYSNISYNRYINEYSQGLHRYYDPGLQKISLLTDLPRIEKCYFCQQEFESKRSDHKFCSNICVKNYKKREAKRKLKINYDKQVVINIDGLNKDDDKYYIIIDLDRDKRDHRFIRKKDTTFVISEDENNIPRYRIHYDINKSVRVKLAHIENYSGFKKIFWITETGVLISRRTKKILSQTIHNTGYYMHATYMGGRGSKCKLLRIHRLVAHAFIPNPDNKPFVNHIDAVKTNNHYTNLEWVTHQENVDHAVRMGLIATGSETSQAAFNEDEIRQIRYLRNVKKLKYKKLLKMFPKVNRKETLIDICKYRTYKNVV